MLIEIKKILEDLYYYFTFTFLLRLRYKKGNVFYLLHLNSKPSKNKSQTQKALHNLHLIIKYFWNYTSRALTSCRFIVGSARVFKKSTIQEKPESCGPLRSTAELTVHISPQLIVPPHTSPMTHDAQHTHALALTQACQELSVFVLFKMHFLIFKVYVLSVVPSARVVSTNPLRI